VGGAGAAGGTGGASAGAAGTGTAGATGGFGGMGGATPECGDHVVMSPEACDDGFKDACGSCNADCTAPGTGSVCGDGKICDETEKCDTGTAVGCGECNSSCDGPGPPCPPTCAQGRAPTQIFSAGMIGCAGTALFGERATLCGSALKVCTADQWVANHAGAQPTHHYWVNDGPMYYWGSDTSGTTCAAYGSSLGSGVCNNADSPMRVCAPSNMSEDHSDPLGNVCNWINCGWHTTAPNHYFGGCNGNVHAGSLCCPP
jgi:hypothetical protein